VASIDGGATVLKVTPHMNYDPENDLYAHLCLVPATATPEGIRRAEKEGLAAIRFDGDGGVAAAARITDAAAILLDPAQGPAYLAARGAWFDQRWQEVPTGPVT